jgi:hypothetical protein
MSLFNYNREQFLKKFPLFQESEEKDLFCVFDNAGNLKEASYFQKSEVLGKYVKFRSVRLEGDQLIEQFGTIPRTWTGQGGSVSMRDKDQNIYETKWSRESKLDELLNGIVDSYLNSKNKKVSEVDEEFKRESERQQRKKDFAKERFAFWPAHLTERRFRIWQSMDPNISAAEYETFFEALKSQDLLDQLDEDQLGAALSKWLNLRQARRR